MEKRPRIPINLTKTDYLIEVIGLIGIACLIILPIYFFNDLPDQIPNHFNTYGQVDSYGNRGIIWLLPAVGLFLYISLTILNKFPFALNYPAKVTNDNAERLYTLGTRTIRLLKIIIVLAFVFLNFKTIQIALNKSTNIGILFLPIIISATIILIGIMIYKMTKNKTQM